MKIERLEKPIPLTERNISPEIMKKLLVKLRKALKERQEKNNNLPNK